MPKDESPPVPAGLDLRDFRWMKLDLIALFNSDFNSTPDDTAWRAGVTLWGKAWHQVPAGSLPNDDARLCNLAGLGRDMKTWKRVKEEALHGFVICTDGRLYHRFLCRMAAEAADERDRYARRKSADRERKSAGVSSGIPAEKRETAPPVPRENPDIPAEEPQIPAEFHRKNPLEGAELLGRIESKHQPSDSVAARESLNGSGNPEVQRDALPAAAPKPLKLRANIKQQLCQKLTRYCNARFHGDDRMKAVLGLMGDDPEHDAQWWLDTLDRQRKREGWDDTRERKHQHSGAR